MGGLTSNPPPDGGGIGGPQVPIPDFVQSGKETAQGIKESGLGDSWIARLIAATPDILSIIIETFVSIADRIMAEVVKLFTLAQGTHTGGADAMVAALLSDLLGVEVSDTAIESAFIQHGPVAEVQAIGASLYDQLKKEFGGDAPVTPEGGIAAAQAFMGFLIQFAVRQGNVSFLQSFLPFQWLEGIREYGETMSRNLGLGRMARRALQPLIQIKISDPLTQALNAQFRPKLLGSALASRAFNRGLIDQPTLDNELAWDGYNDARGKAIQQESLVQLAAAETYVLLRWKLITADDANSLLARFGYDRAGSDKFLAAEAAKRADTELAAFLIELATQRVEGFVDASTFRGIVDTLPLDQPHKDFYLQVVGQRVEFPRKRLSIAEAQAAYVDGILELDDLDTFLAQEGYDDVSHQVLILQTLLKQAQTAESTAVKQYTYNLKVATAIRKGELIPPIPPGLHKAPSAP